MDINKEYKEEIKFIVEKSDKNLPVILREFAEKYHKEQLLIHGVSNRRELLKGYIKWNKGHYGIFNDLAEEQANDYLKTL